MMTILPWRFFEDYTRRATGDDLKDKKSGGVSVFL